MYVYDHSVYSIPRCHYKWAGIKRVEPVSRPRFNRSPPYKDPIENVLRYIEYRPELKKKKPVPAAEIKRSPTIIAYTKRGEKIEEYVPSMIDLFC